MEREQSSPRVDVFYQFENSFFHFTRILGAQDDDFLFGKVGCCHHVGGEPWDILWNCHFPRIDDVDVYSFWKIFLQFFLGWIDEHVPHEQGMVASRWEGPDLQTMSGVPADIAICHKASVFVVDVINGELLDELEWFRIYWDVTATPVQDFFSAFILDDPGVLSFPWHLQPRIRTEGPILAGVRLAGMRVRGWFIEESDLVKFGNSTWRKAYVILNLMSLELMPRELIDLRWGSTLAKRRKSLLTIIYIFNN